MNKTRLLLPILSVFLSGCGLLEPSPRLSEFQLNVINETDKPNSFGTCNSLKVNVSNSTNPDLTIQKTKVTGEKVFKIPYLDKRPNHVNESHNQISIACDDQAKQVFSFRAYESPDPINLYHQSTVPKWLPLVNRVKRVGTLAETQAGSFILIKP